MQLRTFRLWLVLLFLASVALAAAGARFELVSKHARSYGSASQFPVTSPTLRADRAHNTITVASPGDLHLTALAGPKAAMMSFQIDGLTNPTIEIPLGSRLTLDVVNVDDDMAHNLYLSDQAPPYPKNVASPGLGTQVLKPYKGMRYSGAALIVKAAGPGAAYYLCTVPGHAKAGMYGKIVVKQH
ncbi:MAG: plastocyanin/azurin family copper-binding protein [Terriglobales bacterium]